jgi:DNA-binding transcriptional regulator YhcF (GntR family)
MSRSRWKHNASGKTVRRRNRHGPKFVRLFHWMLDTPAWRSLSGWAMAAYLDLAANYNGTNNGELYLPIRKFTEGRDCSPATAARAINELVDKGFVEITRNSGFNIKSHKRQARTFRLTVFFCDLTKSAASNTFTKWKPAEKHSSVSQVRHLGLTGENKAPRGYQKH